MSPRAKKFKTGSIIYFEGDKSDDVYLLKEGKVNLIYNDLTMREEVVDPISKGEFFGVKSGLIHFPREETAKVVTDSIVFEFSAQEFESLISKNTSIILKMLKVFSNQLRKVGKQIRNLVGSNVAGDPSDDFFLIGEYYLKNKKYKQSITVYQRYLHYYPNGRYAALAKNRLKLAENALNAYGEGGGPTPVLDGLESSSSESSFGGSVSGEELEPIGDDLSDLFESDDSNEGEKRYYKAISLMGQQKYLDAYKIFKEIIASSAKEEEKINASFEIGKCFYNLNKYNECIKHLTGFLSKHQQFHEKQEALFYLGNSYAKIGNREKAEKFFKNIIATTSEGDKMHRKALKVLKELG